ncbi:Polyisoprenoid-binding protein YceI [Pseudoxanthomonas wuyuanensis]|uniref:Polyisoprenoid-binding protein YceI n=2 Tax=Pseudoxanthomonas wuyuanensis TaxID=1073196 RepID=A0A286DCK0_9GAMM|nr:YceI family protein [Pseudoxanthomonas wuyuanensis]KAF1719296.1 polyisoprenoid-binding protein [Pseudoxanthomonas wuyuanensis]SOD56385.1 Polyisoprenoid-binding protein YceI [Pseudoxanthomonas wuyuanensis]
MPGLALGLLAALWAGTAMAASGTYQLDPVHTRVMFAVEHAGFSQAIGTVSGSTGTLEFDPDDWRSARLEVSVPLDKLDLGDERWNEATLARNLLDAARHPAATFVSTCIEPIDAQRASVYGTLTLRGVSREVKLDVTLNAIKRHPLPPFRRTAGFSASTVISRADFGITAWKSVIGDRVELRMEVEAVRGRAGANGSAPDDDSQGDAPNIDDAGTADDDSLPPLPDPAPEPTP